MENKKLKEYLDEFKDDAAFHVIVANPQDRKIYVPYELNMICDKGQKDPVLCIEVGQPQDMDAELVEAAMEDERAAQPELPKLKTMRREKSFWRNTGSGRYGLKFRRQRKPIIDIFFQMDQQSLSASISIITSGGRTNMFRENQKER